MIVWVSKDESGKGRERKATVPFFFMRWLLLEPGPTRSLPFFWRSSGYKAGDSLLHDLLKLHDLLSLNELCNIETISLLQAL